MAHIGEEVGLEPGDACLAAEQDSRRNRTADGGNGEADHQDPDDEIVGSLTQGDADDTDRRGQNHRQNHSDGKGHDDAGQAQIGSELPEPGGDLRGAIAEGVGGHRRNPRPRRRYRISIGALVRSRIHHR